MTHLLLEGLTKSFGTFAAVSDLTLTVEQGTRMVILGPSGCGKTTTLRLIAGLESPDAGSIRLGRRCLNDVPPASRGVAMVFQDAALYPHMTVGRNLAFGLQAGGLPKRQVRSRVEETAEAFALTHLLDRYPETLSGGQRRLAALARALVKRPQLLLLDEPFASLDAPAARELQQEFLLRGGQFGVTTLHVTHDQQEAMLMGDRIAVMHDGRIRQVGMPQEIYCRPADRFVAKFVGNPAMNFAPASRLYAAAGRPSPAGCGAADEVGVRPEKIILLSTAEPPDDLTIDRTPSSESDRTILEVVGRIEQLRFAGPQWQIEVRWPGGLWRVVRSGAEGFAVGTEVRMQIRSEDVHHFPSSIA